MFRADLEDTEAVPAGDDLNPEDEALITSRVVVSHETRGAPGMTRTPIARTAPTPPWEPTFGGTELSEAQAQVVRRLSVLLGYMPREDHANRDLKSLSGCLARMAREFEEAAALALHLKSQTDEEAAK